MTRSRCGSLHLHRTTLAFATSRQIRCLRHRVGATTRHPQTGAAEQPRLLNGNLLKIQWLATSHFAGAPRSDSWFPYGNLLILLGECHALPSNEIHKHESH